MTKAECPGAVLGGDCRRDGRFGPSGPSDSEPAKSKRLVPDGPKRLSMRRHFQGTKKKTAAEHEALLRSGVFEGPRR